MKTIKFYVWAMLLAFVSTTFTGCSDNNNPSPDPAPDPTPTPGQTHHFDIWVTYGETGGMSSNAPILIKTNVTDLTQGHLDFNDNGYEASTSLYQETIIKGKYYYQIPKSSAGRFGKYQLKNDKLEKIWDFPFTTFDARKYTHCWVNDKTLILMGASGKSDKVLWAKIDTETPKLIEEGIIDFSAFPEALPAEFEPGKMETYSTSGIAAYRKSDDRILYSFVFNKGSAMKGTSRGKFHMAFINPANMSVEAVATENRAEMMSGTAYGELLQQKAFFDENDDYYLTCNSVLPNATNKTQQKGALLRVKKGERAFDASYNGYKYDSGKLVSINNLGNGMAILYIQDPQHTNASGWGSTFNCYYSILNLATGVKTDLDLPASNGTFSQFAAVLGDVAYIGVHPESGENAIWIYNIKSGELKKGMTVAKGFPLARIAVIEEDNQ